MCYPAGESAWLGKVSHTVLHWCKGDHSFDYGWWTKQSTSAGSPGHTCACDMYLLTFSFLLPYFNHSCIYIFHLCPELWVIVRSWCLWDLLYIGGFNDQHYVGRDCLLLVVAPDCVIFIIMCHDGYFRLRFWTVTDGNRLFYWHDGVYGNLHYFVGKNI